MARNDIKGKVVLIAGGGKNLDGLLIAHATVKAAFDAWQKGDRKRSFRSLPLMQNYSTMAIQETSSFKFHLNAEGKIGRLDIGQAK